MEQCDFPRCKNFASLGYIGRHVCWQHWAQLCEAESKTEKGLLKKIGLMRNNGGAVIQIRT